MFNRKQLQVIKYDNIYKPYIHIQEGAVRSGKSRVNHWLWLNHINKFRNQNKKFLMTSTTLGTLKKNVLDDLEEIFGIDTKLNIYNEFKIFGNTMICAGTDKADSYKAIKGFEAFGWYGNEVTEHHKNSIDQAFKRCSKCKTIWYCSKECQVSDWPNHKVVCNKKAK
jgi:hypothetical protein